MMEKLKLNIDTGIKEITVNEYGDTLKVNTTDASFFDRFISMADRMAKYTEEAQARGNAAIENENSTEGMIELARVMTDLSRTAVKEIDGVFGVGATKKLYREMYEIDADYCPDSNVIKGTLEALTPIMMELYKKRINSYAEKYSVANKGKRTKRAKTK